MRTAMAAAGDGDGSGGWWKHLLDSLGPATAKRVVPFPPRALVERTSATLALSDAGFYFLTACSAIEAESAATVSALPLGELPDETLVDLARGRDPRLAEPFATRWHFVDGAGSPERYAEAVLT